MEVTSTEAVLADQNGDFKHVYNLFGFGGYREQSKQIKAPKKISLGSVVSETALWFPLT